MNKNLFLSVKNFLHKSKILIVFIIFDLLGILAGIFLGILIANIIGHTGDWSILFSGILVAVFETINRLIYIRKKKNRNSIVFGENNFSFLSFLNNIKIGMIYSLLLEAFKLGS